MSVIHCGWAKVMGKHICGAAPSRLDTLNHEEITCLKCLHVLRESERREGNRLAEKAHRCYDQVATLRLQILRVRSSRKMRPVL